MPAPPPGQLALSVSLPSGNTFADFHAGEGQAEALALAERLALHADYPVTCLWGPPQAGKSHLLQAACRAAAGAGRQAAYLPLAEFGYLDPDILRGWNRFALICADDVDRIAGQLNWERAIFGLFNAMQENGGTLLASAAAPPGSVEWALPDWRSRLGWGPVLRIPPLNDADKLAALKLRAGRRGLKLSDEVGRFLLNHTNRDMASLMQLLERLDKASLALQRRLTIPLVKEIVEERGSGVGIRDSGGKSGTRDPGPDS